MFVSKHSKFILTPIIDTLKDSIDSSLIVPFGMESYPIIEYLLQGIFLRMTGCQEQKGKCICWDVATNDLEFRHEGFKKISSECSSLDEKTKIYSNVLKVIKKRDPLYSLKDNSKNILDSSKKDVIDILKRSVLIQNIESGLIVFEKEQIPRKPEFIQNDNELFSNKKNNYFVKIYDFLYRERNRCAHNLRSYQQNLPDLLYLSQEDNKYNNYFFFFWILAVIDKVYIELYKKISQFDYYQ